MDFGKWVEKGLPFADEKSEEWLRKKFLSTENVKTTESNMIVPSKPSDLDFINSQFDGLKKHLIEYPNDPFTFAKCNSYLRKIIYQRVEVFYPNCRVLNDNDGALVVKNLDEAEQEAYRVKLEKENLEKFQKGMGFRIIFNKLVDIKKPIVGHNCFFDLLFILRWFDKPLEENFHSFRIRLNKTFPCVYDTK